MERPILFSLRLLGTLELRDRTGRAIPAVLSRQKDVGILAYLSVARPQGFHRRDTLVGLFWPDLNRTRARAALRKSLHFLRRALGDDVLLSRTDEDVGLDWEKFECDVSSFEGALEAGDPEEALAHYRGDLLPGFFLSGCEEFEKWLELERTRLRELAADTAWAVSDEHLAQGRVVQAERLGQHALSLVCTDEARIRSFIEALAEAGDRAAALRFYERFSATLQAELNLEPSPETAVAVAGIRAGHETGAADGTVHLRPMPAGPPPGQDRDSGREPTPDQEGVSQKQEALPTGFRWRNSTLAASALAVAVLGVVGFLGWKALGPSETEGIDPEVTGAYELGRASLEARSPHALRRAVQQFGRAVELDFNFAPAHAGLAMAYSVQSMLYLRSDAEVAPLARASAGAALAFDSTLADAHVAMAFVKYLFDWDFVGAEEAVRRAIAMDGHSLEALLLYSRLLRSTGRMDEALEPVGLAKERYPLDRRAMVSWARMLADAGRLEESIEEHRRVLETWPDWEYSLFFMGQSYQENGELVEAARIFRELYRDYQENDSIHVGHGDLAVYGSVFGQVGDVESAEEILEDLMTRRAAGEVVASNAIAAVLAGLGRTEEAVDRLFQAYEDREHGIIHLISWQSFDPLHSHPRFQELVRRVFGDLASS